MKTKYITFVVHFVVHFAIFVRTYIKLSTNLTMYLVRVLMGNVDKPNLRPNLLDGDPEIQIPLCNIN